MHRRRPARRSRCSRGLVEDLERARDEVRRRYLRRSLKSATETAATWMASAAGPRARCRRRRRFWGCSWAAMGRDEDDIVDGAMASRSWGLARPGTRSRGRRTWELNVGSTTNSTINQRRRRSAEDEELNSGGTTQQSTYSTATRELQTSGDGDEDDGRDDGAIRKTFGAS